MSATLRVQDEHILVHQTESVNMQGTLRILLLLHAARNDAVSVLQLIEVRSEVSV